MHYAGMSDDDVAYIKITKETASDWGLTEDQAAQQIHARSDGNVTVGVDAFISVWKRLPYYRLLASIIGWRPIRYITDIVYRNILAPTVVCHAQEASETTSNLYDVTTRKPKIDLHTDG